MKFLFFLVAVVISGCSGKTEEQKESLYNDSIPLQGNPAAKKTSEPTTYSNQRFRNVKVSKTGTADTYRITGEAQIFEESFGWVVEDGHNELKKGHEMTNAGAPEWGHFDFTVRVKKITSNAVLHLILFESSAKDGSRQYELPVLLS